MPLVTFSIVISRLTVILDSWASGLCALLAGQRNNPRISRPFKLITCPGLCCLFGPTSYFQTAQSPAFPLLFCNPQHRGTWKDLLESPRLGPKPPISAAEMMKDNAALGHTWINKLNTKGLTLPKFIRPMISWCSRPPRS